MHRFCDSRRIKGTFRLDKDGIAGIPNMILPNSRSCIVIVHSYSTKMRLVGFLLLLSGWGIVVAALALLHGAAISVFILAGVAVEILGFVLVARAHLPSENQG